MDAHHETQLPETQPPNTRNSESLSASGSVGGLAVTERCGQDAVGTTSLQDASAEADAWARHAAAANGFGDPGFTGSPK